MQIRRNHDLPPARWVFFDRPGTTAAPVGVESVSGALRSAASNTWSLAPGAGAGAACHQQRSAVWHGLLQPRGTICGVSSSRQTIRQALKLRPRHRSGQVGTTGTPPSRRYRHRRRAVETVIKSTHGQEVHDPTASATSLHRWIHPTRTGARLWSWDPLVGLASAAALEDEEGSHAEAAAAKHAEPDTSRRSPATPGRCPGVPVAGSPGAEVGLDQVVEGAQRKFSCPRPRRSFRFASGQHHRGHVAGGEALAARFLPRAMMRPRGDGSTPPGATQADRRCTFQLRLEPWSCGPVTPGR